MIFKRNSAVKNRNDQHKAPVMIEIEKNRCIIIWLVEFLFSLTLGKQQLNAIRENFRWQNSKIW